MAASSLRSSLAGVLRVVSSPVLPLHPALQHSIRLSSTASTAPRPNKPSLGVLPPLPKFKVERGPRFRNGKPEFVASPPFVASHVVSGTGVSVSDAAKGNEVTWMATTGSSEESDSTYHSSSADEGTAVALTKGAERRSGSASGSRLTVAPATRFAVIGLGGTQYKVTTNDIINAEYLPTAIVGTQIHVKDVKVVGDASRTAIGRPVLTTASVICAVEEHTYDAKDIVFKKRRRKRYQLTKGHRRLVTRLRVVDIVFDWPKMA